VAWDPEKYKVEVLEPARRAGNVPPPDLYVRYGLPRDISNQKAFDERISEVVGYWHTLKSKRTYARLAEQLIAKHAELERSGRLTLQRLVELDANAHRKQTEQLAELAKTEANSASHVGPVTVAKLHGALRGAVTDAEVRAALRKAGVRVVDELPEMPTQRHPKLTDLIRDVDLLSLRLSPEAVFGTAELSGFKVLGGFRLRGGDRLTEEAINEARRRADQWAHSDPAKTPTKNVLAILSGAVRSPADLNALLLSEIAERLRGFADGDFAQRTIASEARNLGLDEEEAGLIAAATLVRKSVGPIRQQAEEELAGGRLRSAQRLVTSLPADDPLRQTVAARDAEVAALSRNAEGELAAGRPEQAARLLQEAIALASDDPQLPERLSALPPPPPRRAAGRVNGDHVLVTWEASPVLAGHVHYRVMRNEGHAPASSAEGTVVVAQTDKHDVADAQAPPGAALFYSVFAARGGDAWSPPAATQSVIFTPEVTAVSVETSETSVVLSWRVHPGTDIVQAVRAEGRPPQGPQDGTAVEASLAGLTDSGLRTGTEYFYRISAAYRTPDGQRRSSAGVVVPAVPAPAPDAVAHLEVRASDNGSGGLVAAWAPPRYGQVHLVRSGRPPAWPVGARLTAEEVAGLRRVSGVPRRGPGGQDLLELNLPPGRHYLLALTTAGRAVVVGDSAEVGLAEPVQELSVLRMGAAVRLSWIWPSDATDAVVAWPGGEHNCSRRVYEDEGGVTINVGLAETPVEVRAVYSHPDGVLTAPGVHATVPGRGVTLNYRIHRVSRMHPRQRVVEVATEQPTTLPPLVVVRATGPYAPDDPADGEAVAHIETQAITPGQPVRVTVELPKGPAWLACFVDPGSPKADARGVLLFPPPAEEMRIR
jgi:hypothetical protein